MDWGLDVAHFVTHPKAKWLVHLRGPIASRELLLELNLPAQSPLFSNPPQGHCMPKSHVKKYLAFKAQLDFIEDCEAYHISSYVISSHSATNSRQ